MKLTAAAAILVSCVPSLGFAQEAGYGWWFLKFPSGGLNDITFRYNIAHAPHQNGYRFTQQFGFQYGNGTGYGYTSLLPRRDAKGKSIIQATFQSFLFGTTAKHANCSKNANFYGVGCNVEIDGDYSHTYSFEVENTKDTTWRGTLVDTVTHKSYVVGEWTLPKAAGKIDYIGIGYID